MPLWVAALLGGLIEVAGTLVGKVLLSLGIGYVTFTGIDTSLTWAKSAVIASFTSLPVGALQLLGTMKVGVCLSIVFSALTVRMLLNGLTSGAVTRMVTKPAA